MSTVELSIDIPAEHAKNIFGAYDEHIKSIEKTLNVEVNNRNGTVHITGSPMNTAKAKRLLAQLLIMSERGTDITTQNVTYALSLLMDGREGAMEDLDSDIIIHTMAGRPIKPKTLGQKEYVDSIRKRMIPRQNSQHRILRKGDPFVIGQIAAAAQKTNVRAGFFKPALYLLPYSLHKADGYIGIICPETLDDRREPVRGDTGIRRNGNFADIQPLDFRGGLKNTLLLLQKRPDDRQEPFAGLRQMHALTRAVQKCQTQICFQRCHKLADARGRVV